MTFGASCKIIFLGDSQVGKTCLIRQFIDQEFTSDFKATIGADFSSRSVTVDGVDLDLQIWDTAGQERFHSIGTAFYRGTNACVLVFDVTNYETFEHLSSWRRGLVDRAEVLRPEDFPFVVFANKCDLIDDRVVAREEAEAYQSAEGLTLFEVSAKTGENVETGMLRLLQMHLAYQKKDVVICPIDLTPTKQKHCCD
jgi:Ras-related protein Rab-7A